MQIDLDPRKHSSSYELKPESKWWLVLVCAFAVFFAFLNGVTRYETWGLLLFGAGIGFALILTSPKTWLSRLD